MLSVVVIAEHALEHRVPSRSCLHAEYVPQCLENWDERPQSRQCLLVFAKGFLTLHSRRPSFAGG